MQSGRSDAKGGQFVHLNWIGFPDLVDVTIHLTDRDNKRDNSLALRESRWLKRTRAAEKIAKILENKEQKIEKNKTKES